MPENIIEPEPAIEPIEPEIVFDYIISRYERTGDKLFIRIDATNKPVYIEHMYARKIVIIMLLFLSVVMLLSLAKAEAEDVILYQGVSFTVEKDSQLQQRWKQGERVFLIRNGRAIPVRVIKAEDYVAPIAIGMGIASVALQIEEIDENDNTVWVYVDMDTEEIVE